MDQIQMSEINFINKIMGSQSQVAITVLVGVCLSLLFFVTADNFVSVKINEVQDTRRVRASEAIKNDFSSVKDSYFEVVELTKLLDVDSFEIIKDYEFHNKNISSLFWIKAKELSLSSKVNPAQFLGHQREGDLSWYLTPDNISKIKDVYKVFSKRDLGIIKSISVEARVNESLNGEWKQNNEVVLLLSLLRSKDGSLGILVGVVDIKNVFKNMSIYEEIGVNNISIELNGDSNLFEISKEQRGGVFDNIFLRGEFNSSFAYSEFKKIYNAKVSFNHSYLEMLLKAIPLTVFIAFLCITLFYAFIKYLNIRRTNEMRILNEGLAHKNIELKAEIKKRETMNFVVRQSEQENKAIINSINDVIFELNSDEEIMFVNDTWQRMTGHSVANAIKTKLFSYIDEKESKEEADKLQKLLKGEISAYSSLFRIRNLDGHLKPVEMTISMLRQDKNKNVRVVGSITDLEEKEKAAQAIVEAEENYKRIWKNAANGIYEVGLDGKLMSANPAMAKILGYDDTDQLIRSITNMNEMIYVVSNEKSAQINLATREGKTKKFEIKAYKKDGEEIWLEEFMQTVTDDNGNIIHLEGIIDDITERKKSGEALMKAKAESDMANRAKSDFLANMSHELRTPLNSIIGFAEIIKDEVMGKIEEPVYTEYAGEIHKSGNGLLSIINQILDVSKIESGDRELNESLVSLNKVSSDTVNLFSAKIKEKQINVVNEIDKDISDLIAEDRSVRQMLYNIMSNAVKFAPKSGEISIKAYIDDDNNMRLSVSDNGEGLSEDQVKRALKPFDLLDGEHSREKYGAGLGLTLVKLLMDMHGGYIDMQSEKNVGTTVFLVFPSERVRNANKEEASKLKDIDKKPSVDVPNFEGADIFSDSSSESIH